MSLELLKNNIKIGVKSSSGTELGRFQHYNATLNKILKNQIIDPENIQLAFGDDLENTIKRYKTYLESQGKDDNSIRSFLTRLRGLSNYYSKVFEIDVEKVTFTELLQLAVARKYGSKLYTKRIALEERHLHQKYTTYLNVAKDIVISSCEDPTKPWGDIDLKKNDVVRGLAKGVLL